MNNVIAQQSPVLSRALGINPDNYKAKQNDKVQQPQQPQQPQTTKDELKTSTAAAKGNEAKSVNLFKSIPHGMLEGGALGLAGGLAIGSTMSGLGALVPVMAGAAGGVVVGAVTRPLVDKFILPNVDKSSDLAKGAKVAQKALDISAGIALTGGAALLLNGLAPEAAQVAIEAVAGKALTVGAIGAGVAGAALLGIGAYAAYQHLSK